MQTLFWTVTFCLFTNQLQEERNISLRQSDDHREMCSEFTNFARYRLNIACHLEQ